MSTPKTIDEVVQWCSETHDPEVVRDLVVRMMSLPDPWGDEAVIPSRAWTWIVNFELLYSEGRFGWIDRDGRFLGTAHAAHEHLLRWLGMEASDAESAGWVRVSQSGWQCLYRLTARQRVRLEKMGLPVDNEEERLKPVWTANTETTTRPRP